MAPARPKKEKLSDRLADEILRYISENDLEQGDKLPNEAELMEILGAGRSSVREAMKTLASRNVVVIKQGSGTYVNDPSGVVDDPLGFAFVEDKRRLAIDILELRLILEPEIASLAAERASEGDVETIRLLQRQIEALQNQGDPARGKDAEFHEAIALSSRNIVVPRLIPVIFGSIPMSITLVGDRNPRKISEEHRLIADAIAEHDPIGARQTMYAHIYASRLKLLEQIERLGDDESDRLRRARYSTSEENPLLQVLRESAREVLDFIGADDTVRAQRRKSDRSAR